MMTSLSVCRSLMIASLTFLFAWQDYALSQAVTPETKRLGNLELSVSKVEHSILIADSFTGPTHYTSIAQVYLRIRNVGEFPICAELIPTVEEYKDSELWNTEPIKTGLPGNPKVRNLKPGEESKGRYDFELSPVRRAYVLVLQLRDKSQGCEKDRKSKRFLVSGERTARLSLASISQ